MSKTFLFFPIEVGIAHMARSMAVACELAARGHRVVFAIPKRKQHLFQSCRSVEIIDIQGYVEDDFVVKVSTMTEYSFVKKMVAQELEIIKKYKPDATIVDFRISALASSRIARAKTYIITNGDALPYSSYLPNPGLPKYFYKLGLPVIQKAFDIGTRRFLRPLRTVLSEYGVDTTFDDWFSSVSYIVPESPHYLPPVCKYLDINYVGPLFWNKFDAITPSWFDTIRPNGKTIYLTFGGTGFDKNKLISLASKLAHSGFRVVVTSGSICESKDFPQIGNLFVTKYLPGDQVCKRVDFMICHGGYGTMLDAVKAGKPIIAIPFNPDQIVHGHAWKSLV